MFGASFYLVDVSMECHVINEK